MHGKYSSFGATSAVLTGLAVIVGLSGTVNPAVSIITALTIIAIADNVSDSFGIHVHQESQKESVKEVRRITIANFATRFLVAAIFFLFVIFLPMRLAVTFSMLFGLAVISFISYFIAKEQEADARKMVSQHLLLTILIIGASFLLRELSSGLIAKFMSER
jgi:Na+-driven multidrug efflux pump